MRRLLLALKRSLLRFPGFAQEATVTGTVVDQTGGVLPGVTVTALHEATGNTFVQSRHERGIFRLPVPRRHLPDDDGAPGAANVPERFKRSLARRSRSTRR